MCLSLAVMARVVLFFREMNFVADCLNNIVCFFLPFQVMVKILFSLEMLRFIWIFF